MHKNGVLGGSRWRSCLAWCCGALAIMPLPRAAASELQRAIVRLAPLVTYGPSAPRTDGDPDNLQVIFLAVSKHETRRLVLKLFDPDCGGDLDRRTGDWDTATRFTLMGGAGVWSTEGVRSASPTPEVAKKGTIIAQGEYGFSAAANVHWENMGVFAAAAGEEIYGERLFKLVVEGVQGDDGNVFEFALRVDGTKDETPRGFRSFSYAPTFRLSEAEEFVEIGLEVAPGIKKITVAGFDLGGAKASLDNPWRSMPWQTPTQVDGWYRFDAELDPLDSALELGLVLGGGVESPNDLTVSVTAEQDAIALELPIRVVQGNKRPVAAFVERDLGDCRTIAFDASGSVDPDKDNLTYLWDFGDGTAGEGLKITHRYPSPGTFAVGLRVDDDSGRVGRSSNLRKEVKVNRAPTAQITAPNVGAPNQPVAFDASASKDSDGAISDYVWDFGDGITANGVKVTHVFSRPGRFDVRLFVTDDSKSACDSESQTRVLMINAPPIADAQVPRKLSVGEVGVFSAQRSFDIDGAITRYAWNFGDSTTAEGASVQHSYVNPGSYEVVLQVYDDAAASNSVAQERRTVVVNHPPQARARAGATRVAMGEIVVFDASLSTDPDGRITRYFWDLGDGYQAQGKIVRYSYLKPGNYRVMLLVEDDSGSKSSQDNVYLPIVVNAPPVANAGGDKFVRESEVQFDGSASSDSDGKIARFTWFFGDGTVADGIAPTHVFSAPGVYRVRLVAHDDSGTENASASDEIRVTVNARPIADAGPDKLAAPGEVVSFSGTESLDPDGEIVSYQWNFGDGEQASGMTVAHAFTKPGTYTARLTVQDSSGDVESVDHDALRVVVNAAPVARAGMDQVGDPGALLEFDGSHSYDLDGSINTYRWTFSDGQGATNEPKTKRRFDQPGVYVATIAVRDNSGATNTESRAVMLVRINQRPQANAGKDVFTCDNNVSFDASASTDADGDALSYAWTFGDGMTSNAGAAVFHNYATGGTYPVVLKVDDKSGRDNAASTASINVVINQPPVANAGGNKTVCAGEPVIFSGTASRDPEGGRLKYRWDFGDGTQGEGVNPTTVYKQGGVFTATLQVEDDSKLACNSDSDQVVVRVAESPVADAGADQSVCANTEVVFDGMRSRDFDGLVNGFAWDFGDGSFGSGAKATHFYSAPGNYKATLTVTGDQIGDCDNTAQDNLKVTVHDAPVAVFTTPAIVALGERILFDGSASAAKSSNIVAYEWDFGDGKTATGVKADYVYTKPGRYLAKLVVRTNTTNGCDMNLAKNLVVVNAAPIANAGTNRLVGANELVVFNGMQSKDPDGNIAEYRWDFGDGESATGAEVNHRFVKPGIYQVRLRVQDDTKVANNATDTTVQVQVNHAPKPMLSGPTAACVGEETLFNGQKSVDEDGQIRSYQWTFGDGATAQGPQVVHRYARPGSYQVTLTVEDNAKVSNSRAQTAAVLRINQPPRAAAGADRLVCPGEKLAFDGSASRDPEGDKLQFLWTFAEAKSAAGVKAEYVYSQPGTYGVKLVVTDDSGTSCSSSEDTALIRVNTPPVAQAGPDRTALAGGALDAVTFDAGQSSDADGDALSFAWDFGDGSSAVGSKVVHSYARGGKYKVQLRVSDGTGLLCGVGSDEAVVEVKSR